MNSFSIEPLFKDTVQLEIIHPNSTKVSGPDCIGGKLM